MNNTYTHIDDLLAWFKERPRTLGWDAMLAFDQASTNALLLQQYIERFGRDSYLEPVNGTIELGSGKVVEISNYLFDKPRLSFEHADLQSPTATLRIQGLGGLRLTWNVSGTSPKLDAISYEYPVNGDIHQSTVTLTSKSVSVQDRKVIIDVASGSDPLLKFGGTLNEKQRAGEWVKREFGLKPPEVREYVLSELKTSRGFPYEPEDVVLLTQAAPEGHRRDSSRYGDGAVIAFVRMTGGTNGDKPSAEDAQWRYLLDHSAEGHSALLVYSQEFLLRGVISQLLRSHGFLAGATQDRSDWALRIIDDGVWKTIISEGNLAGNFKSPPGSSVDYNVGLSSNLSAVYSGFKDNSVNLTSIGWASVSDEDIANPEIEGMELRTEIDVVFAVRTIVNERALVLLGLGTKTVDWPQGPIKQLNDQLNFMPGLKDGTLNLAVGIITSSLMGSIVLPGDRPISLKDVAIPGDMVLYGNVSQERVGLRLNQHEVLVGAGNSFQFSTDTPGSATWTIELVDGQANGPGAVSDSGLYTAPAVTSTYARVRLTVTRGGHTNQALITVVRELAAVSPAVQLAVTGSRARYFVRGGAVGEWEWDTSGLKGELKLPDVEPGDEFEPGDMQYIPPATLDGDYLVEEIRVKVGSNVSTCKVIVTKGDALTLVAELAADGLSATVKVVGSDGQPAEVPLTKVAGSGQLDGNRVTSEDQPVEPFIVVQASIAVPVVGTFSGYLLLPQPLRLLEGTRSLAILQDPALTF